MKEKLCYLIFQNVPFIIDLRFRVSVFSGLFSKFVSKLLSEEISESLSESVIKVVGVTLYSIEKNVRTEKFWKVFDESIWKNKVKFEQIELLTSCYFIKKRWLTF